MEHKWICPNCLNSCKESELCQKPLYNKLSHKTEYELACPNCGSIGIEMATRKNKLHQVNLFDYR